MSSLVISIASGEERAIQPVHMRIVSQLEERMGRTANQGSAGTLSHSRTF
ncbi:hypothetical protein PS874_04811 [Pseudomonas fluorescens]|jgi:hypothetical protein|nr:hypothetical protein PS874_04811 [Pseudomonas fluorescens]